MVRDMSATDTIHRHHAQQAYNGNGVALLRRYHGRAWYFEDCFGEVELKLKNHHDNIPKPICPVSSCTAAAKSVIFMISVSIF